MTPMIPPIDIRFIQPFSSLHAQHLISVIAGQSLSDMNPAVSPGRTLSSSSAPKPQERTSLTTLERQTQTANAFAILVCFLVHQPKHKLIITTQSTLFAGVQAQLLSGIPAKPSPKISQALIRTLQFASYGGLAINISAALAAILFISFANMIPAEREDITQTNGADDVIEDLLRQASKLRLDFIGLTCVGTYFVLLQISLLAWTSTAPQNSTVVFALVIAVVWLSFHPFTVYTKLLVCCFLFYKRLC